VRRPLVGLALLGVLGVSGVACVDGDIPPRPSVDAGSGADGDPMLLARASICDGMNLAVSGDTLYWTEEATGTVRSVPTSGGPPTSVATTQVRPTAIAVDSTYIFWVAGGGKTIVRKPVAGGNATVFVRATMQEEILGGENDINALLVAKNTLYFGRYIYASRIPTDGTMPKVISESPQLDRGIPGAFALDATHLYQVEMAHNAVTRELLDGTQNGLLEGGTARQPLAPDRIAVSQGGLLTDAIAVVDDDVIWANDSSIESKVGNFGENTPATTVTTSLGGNRITGFVVSDGVIYFGEAATDTVEMAPLATGIATVIATNQKAPGQFLADAANIYWRTSDCEIMRLAKPAMP
jgi:hypothetical protein